MKLSIILSQLSTGMAGTISIFVLTLVFSLPLGLLIAFGRMSKNRIVSGIFRLYISLMRGTPLMLQLMVVYFGPLPKTRKTRYVKHKSPNLRIFCSCTLDCVHEH